MVSKSFKYAFTIVELLVVIIVIAVLVTLSIVGYSGISNKANVASLQSDLTNAKKQLLAFQAQSSTNSFPTAINCTNPSATEICIRASGNNTFSYGFTNNPINSFMLAASNSAAKYQITESTNCEVPLSIVTSGMVMNLDAGNPLSYPGSGNTWTDLTSNGDSNLYNGVVFDPNNGGAFSFDGIDDYIDTNRDLSWNNTGSTTLSVWLKVTLSQYKPFIGKGTDWEWELLQNTNTIKHIYWNISGNHTNGPITDIANVFDFSSWRNVTVVWSHSSAKLYFYINGGLVSTVSWYDASNNANKSNTVKVGGSLYTWSSAGNYWKGLISIVHYYNRALSSSEVQQNFNAIRDRYGV